MFPRRPRVDAVAVALGIVLVLPAVVLVLGVILYPLGYEFWLSLTDGRAGEPGGFVGLANYVDLIGNARYWESVATTIGYVLIATGAKLALGLAMAVSLAAPFPGRPVVFVFLLLPWLFPAALSATALHWMLNPVLYSGVVLQLDRLSHPASIWIEEAWPLARIILIDVWRGTSFVGVFLLVGINAIPRDLFDVAAVEGGGPWETFRRVTLPLVRTPALLATVLSIGAALGDFTNLYLLTGGRETTHVIGTLAYETALTRGEVGLGAAMSLSILPLIVLLLLSLIRALDRDQE